VLFAWVVTVQLGSDAVIPNDPVPPAANAFADEVTSVNVQGGGPPIPDWLIVRVARIFPSVSARLMCPTRGAPELAATLYEIAIPVLLLVVVTTPVPPPD